MTLASTDWRPILEDEWAEQAWMVIRDVAAAVPDAALGDDFVSVDPSRLATLASGSAGQALFYAYLAEATCDEAYADLAEHRLDHAIEVLANVAMPPGLFTGFTGVGWVAQHLEGWLFESAESGDGTATQIDESLLQMLRRPSWNADYDLISGLVGFGVYALGGLPREQAKTGLELVLEQLERRAEPGSAGGLTWLTPPENLPPHQRRECPQGYYNLGVAHGVPGAVALLAAACAAGVTPARARRLLDGSVRWLLGQENESSTVFRFPSWVGPRHRALVLAPGLVLWRSRCSGSSALRGPPVRRGRMGA